MDSSLKKDNVVVKNLHNDYVNKEDISNILNDIKSTVKKYDSLGDSSCAELSVKHKLGANIGLLSYRLSESLGVNPQEINAFNVLDDEYKINKSYLKVLVCAGSYCVDNNKDLNFD